MTARFPGVRFAGDGPQGISVQLLFTSESHVNCIKHLPIHPHQTAAAQLSEVESQKTGWQPQ
jgi:O-acetylhomoserine/O-acetylserine sulfhydrylase-like pyridoxal-dependent enzyme